MLWNAIPATLAATSGDAGSPLVPLWIALPAAIVALIAVGAHISSLRSADVPESRRRIRSVNGWIMAALIPVAVYAFGVVTPAEHGRFVFVFALLIGLLAIVVLMAGLDVLNNLRIYKRERAEMQREIRQLRGEGQSQRGSKPGA